MARCSHNDCQTWRPKAAIRLLTLGLRVDDAWFCSNRCVKADVERRLRDVGAKPELPAAPAARLGTILMQQKKISAAQLSAALEAQRESGLRLGRQLLRLGVVTEETVLAALSAQSGVRYLAAIDHATLRTAPGGLSADEVRALGVVPFAETGEQLRVACPAPVPRAALDALSALIGRSVEAFLVADDAFEPLLRAYGAAASPVVSTLTVRGIADGAERVTAFAVAAGSVTVKEAHVDPFTWVRMAAHGRVSTLLVSPNPRRAEEHRRWQAATTRH